MPYQHPNDGILRNLHHALEYNDAGEPVLRVTLGNDSLSITGNVTIPGTIEISNDVGNAVPISGNVNANVNGNVNIDNFPTTQTVDGNVGILGNIAIGSLPEVEIKNESGNALSVAQVPDAVWDTTDIRFKTAVSAGEQSVFTHIHKFGGCYNLDEGASNMVTVWDGSSQYPWGTFSGSGDQLYVKTPVDDANIRGANVTVIGLDSDYNEISEVVTLNASNTEIAVNTTNNYYRVVRAYFSSSNDEYFAHAQDVNIRYGSDTGTIVARLDAPYAQTQMALYTVPANHSAFLLNCDGSSGFQDEITSMLWARPFGGSWRLVHTFKYVSGQYNHEFRIPLYFPEKTDLEIRAFSLSESAEVTAHFELILRDDS